MTSSNNITSESQLFTKQMREATRDVHSLSDALINAKLGIALGSNAVWAEGLLVFYEVFKQLEKTMTEHPEFLLSQFDIEGIRRTALFEKDLEFYLGKNWRDGYEPRESVREYVDHLRKLEDSEPELLLAYAYHMYMGLLSGGQILRKKRALVSRLKFSTKHSYEGLAVTEVTSMPVFKMKKLIAAKMNEIAQEFDEEMREKLIAESRKVFEFNDKVVRSIEDPSSDYAYKVKIYTGQAIGGNVLSCEPSQKINFTECNSTPRDQM
ncbi:hem oxygenase-like [Trinorchestia longiramus]|nr:hem oxygenase-like [Trinorchestia longiramus]